jgi:uncharacterized repeat protein (TIGR01451 family)
MLLTGLSALALVVALSLLLSHFQVRAEPVAETEAAALHVEKQVMQEVTAPGEVLTYVISVRSSGDEPTVAWLTDALPSELEYVSESLSATFGTWGVADRTITWTAEMFGFDYTGVLTFGARISDELTYAEIMNTAQVTGAGALVEDSASTTAVTETGNLNTSATTKTVSSNEAKPGDTLTYTIRIANVDSENPYDVIGAHLTDTLPAGLTYVSDSLRSDPPVDTLGEDNGVITWTNTVPYSSSHEIQFTAQISEGVSIGAWLTNPVEIAAPGQTFTRSVSTYVRPDRYYAYFPRIFKRWPPIPYSPSLNPISNPGYDRDYTVSWSYDDAHPENTEPDTYTLQEATEVGPYNWTTVYEGPNTSVGFSGKPGGHYYYRVRGNNEFGPGEWSNVEDVRVWQYEDDFSDYQSGWPREWSDTRGALYQVRPYENPGCGPNEDCKYGEGDGYVIARRSQSEPFARFGPGVEVPGVTYQLRAESRWFEAQYHAAYEIFFSADHDFDTFYSVKVRIDNPDKPSGDPPKCEYRVYRHTDDGDKVLSSGFWNRSSSIRCGVVRCDGGDSCGDTAWNQWMIERDGPGGEQIRVEVNGDLLLQTTDDDPLGPDRGFGVGATLYEGLTPSKPVFDNWSVRLLD